jgi:hypothetical protein
VIGRTLALLQSRWPLRVLIGALVLSVLVLALGLLHENALQAADNARVTGILQGKISLAQAEIQANGETLEQFQAAYAELVQRQGADADAIAQVQQQIAAIQASDSALATQLQQLQDALTTLSGAHGGGGTGGGNGGGGGGSPSPSRPAPTPVPTARPCSPPVAAIYHGNGNGNGNGEGGGNAAKRC